MKKWEQKQLTIKLRKQGLSYKEIAAKISVSKGSLSNWCRDIALSPQQLARLGKKYDFQLRGAKANKEKRKSEIFKITASSISEIAKIKGLGFFISGVMLYWAEGNKTLYPGISNSDPFLIKFMIKWFKDICHVPENKFKAHLHLHSGQDEGKIKTYWSKLTGIPIARFGKSYIKKEGSGHKKNLLYNGTIKISIYNKNLLYKILGWIEGIKRRIK